MNHDGVFLLCKFAARDYMTSVPIRDVCYMLDGISEVEAFALLTLGYHSYFIQD